MTAHARHIPIAKAGSFEVDFTDTGSGPAVLLVHSSGSGNRQWRRLIEEQKHQRRLLAPNFFGYGSTPAWPGTRKQTLADQATLIAAVASVVEGPISLIGHSMGGAIALEAAITLGKQVQQIIVFEPTLFDLLKQHSEKEAYADIRAAGDSLQAYAAKNELESAGELFIDYWSAPGRWAAMPADRRAGIIPLVPSLAYEFDSCFAPGRPIDELDRISAPVHVIHAEDTCLPTRRVAAVLADRIPKWRFHRIEAGGHMAPIMRPDLVNPLIAGILDGKLP